MPPLMRFYSRTKSKTEKTKSKSRSKSISFSPATKNKIASFTKKRVTKHLFKRLGEIQETTKKIASFTRKRDIKRLFRRIKNKQAANTCAICFNTMINNGATTKTPCRHKFHSACLNTWLNTNNTCPLCRRQVQVPVIVPQINQELAQQIVDANDDANELAILQMVENYWTERGMTPVQVELLKLCKLEVLKLARLIRRYSRANTNGLRTAQTNARTYAAAHHLDLDYYYSLEDTYHPSLPLEVPPADIAPTSRSIMLSPRLPSSSSLRTAYII